MHILFLTDNFPPEVNAPASRTFEHAKHWVALGHKVTVITCAPNFPDGKVFLGYKNRIWQSESIEGIRVIRVWTYITSNDGFFKRILDFLSFMLSSFIASLFIKRFDIVIGTSPQFFTACSAYMVGLIKRKPFVFELRDLWPETIRVVGGSKSRILLSILERLELFLYRKAKLVIAVTNSFKSNLVSRGIDSEKIKVVTNGVQLDQFNYDHKARVILRKELGWTDNFIVSYIGTHGECQKLETVLNAAEYCQKTSAYCDVRFLFVGSGSQRRNLMLQAHELSNVKFLPQVPKEDVAGYWSAVDLSIVHLVNHKMFKSVIPSKIFESMAMQVPIALGVEGEAKKIINENNVGLSFKPEDHMGLVSCIHPIMTDKALVLKLKHNCRTSAGKYERNQLATKMLYHLERIIK
ncbi:glycosyltransferase family 4 protein [Planktomarina temperata]|nr:glycosyltransferase family 4 protein [Planktomarina temperata]